MSGEVRGIGAECDLFCFHLMWRRTRDVDDNDDDVGKVNLKKKKKRNKFQVQVHYIYTVQCEFLVF